MWFTEQKIVLSGPQVVVIVVQELGAVVFNIWCGARLGDHDYYYVVTGDNAMYTTAANASFISNTSLSSMFVLFLTLHVFKGPFLNYWRVFLDYICVKTEEPSEDNQKSTTQ